MYLLGPMIHVAVELLLVLSKVSGSSCKVFTYSDFYALGT